MKAVGIERDPKNFDFNFKKKLFENYFFELQFNEKQLFFHLFFQLHHLALLCSIFAVHQLKAFV